MKKVKKDSIYSEYQKDRANGKCWAKYYEFGFIDIMFDQCDCKDCSRYSYANDVVDDKSVHMTATDALKQAGFADYEVEKYIYIFEDLGIYTKNEIAGIPEIQKVMTEEERLEMLKICDDMLK